MSCTENESGPFVVFFLPAVVGCLTILLARRWACSQVSNTSSTAVSRRRKIIKDPLIKRPLPTIPCKMVAPTSKKSAGVTKKGTVPPCEDDTSGGKRMARPRLSATAPNMGTNSKLDAPLHPKHIPFPYIPQDGEVLFESMSLVFALMATALQYLNIYRTAWWLPHSLNDQTVSYYLIDPHVVVFIVAILSRRFVYIMSLTVMRHLVPEKKMPLAHVIASFRMFMFGVVIGSLGWCTYFIVRAYPIVKIFYLCYPAVIYVLLFGLELGPFLELDGSAPAAHSCSADPAQVRAEVDVLRTDFNVRVKKILFNSVVGAYYTSFVPCCFAQPFVYYEVVPAAQQVCLVWGALCGRYAARLLPAAAADAPHRAAAHLGRWAPRSADHEGEDVPAWSGARMWAGGARARHGGALHVAAAPAVAAEPHCAAHVRFYSVFNDPSTLLCILLCMQVSLVALQICLLFSSLAWNNFLAIVLLLFINYYTLFKMLRDYLVAWKVYKAENMIQDKNGSVHMSVN